jgi:hypothetical protein
VFGFLLRLDSELTLEDAHAELVLVEGGAPSPELGVKTHERAVHRFLQRIERDQPEPGLQGGFHGPGGPLGGD